MQGSFRSPFDPVRILIAVSGSGIAHIFPAKGLKMVEVPHVCGSYTHGNDMDRSSRYTVNWSGLPGKMFRIRHGLRSLPGSGKFFRHGYHRHRGRRKFPIGPSLIPSGNFLFHDTGEIGKLTSPAAKGGFRQEPDPPRNRTAGFPRTQMQPPDRQKRANRPHAR